MKLEKNIYFFRIIFLFILQFEIPELNLLVTSTRQERLLNKRERHTPA